MDSIELHTPDIVYRATSIGTPAIDDPAIDDPAIDDPAIDDPAIDDPAIDDPAIDDPAIDDPAIDDPAIDDPAIDDPAIDDPAIDDPAIDDASVAASSIFDPDTSTGTNNSGQKLTQITWKVALKGNTTTSMTSKVFLAVSDAKLAALKQAIGPGKSQLLVSRRYRTSDLRGAGCSPVRVSSYQVIANVVDPVLTNNPAPPNLVNPEFERAELCHRAWRRGVPHLPRLGQRARVQSRQGRRGCAVPARPPGERTARRRHASS